MAIKQISDLPLATTVEGAEAMVTQANQLRRLPLTLVNGASAAVNLSNGNPEAPGNPSSGTSQQASRSDHVHPRDTSKMDNPTGQRVAGRVPMLQTDLSISWADPPSAGTGGGGVVLGSITPAMDGTAATGTATTAARADHVHPRDTSKMDNPTGTKTAGAVPVVSANGATVAWAQPPTDASRMAAPTGTKAAGRVPAVTGDGSTVAWTDPPSGTALTLGNNRLLGTDSQGNVVPMRGATSVAQSFEGAPAVGAKLVFTSNAPWPGTVDQIAAAIEGTASPSVSIRLEKVTAGTGATLGGVANLLVNSGARDNPAKTTLSGTRSFAAGDAIRVTVTAVTGTITGLMVELTLNRLAG